MHGLASLVIAGSPSPALKGTRKPAAGGLTRRFSSQPIVRLRVLKDSTSFSSEADSAPDVIGTKELSSSSAPQVFNADVRSSVVLLKVQRQCRSVVVLSHPSSLLE